MLSLKPLPFSHEKYLEAFTVFQSHSTARQAIAQCIQEGLGESLAKQRSEFSDASRKSEDAYRILGVGSGSGKADLAILELVANHIGSSSCLEAGTEQKAKIFNRVVEPSPEEVKQFKQKVDFGLTPALTNINVSFEWLQTTFQDYTSQDLAPIRFDLIHFIHSTYYMNEETTLVHCLDKELDHNGFIFCLVHTSNSYFPKLTRKFQHEMKFGTGDVVFQTAEELISLAESHEWSCDRRICPFQVDVTKCYDPASKEGNLLLDFLTHQQDFREKADPDLLARVMELFENNSIVDEKGSRYLRGEMGTVVIWKR